MDFLLTVKSRYKYSIYSVFFPYIIYSFVFVFFSSIGRCQHKHEPTPIVPCLKEIKALNKQHCYVRDACLTDGMEANQCSMQCCFGFLPHSVTLSFWWEATERKKTRKGNWFTVFYRAICSPVAFLMTSFQFNSCIHLCDELFYTTFI